MCIDVVIGLSAVIMLVDLWSDVENILVNATAFALEVVVEVACAMKVLAGAIIGAPGTGAEVSTNGLAAVAPSPLEEPCLCC